MRETIAARSRLIKQMQQNRNIYDDDNASKDRTDCQPLSVAPTLGCPHRLEMFATQGDKPRRGTGILIEWIAKLILRHHSLALDVGQ